MKFNMLIALLLLGGFVSAQAMEKEKLPEIRIPIYSKDNSFDITNEEFDSISRAKKFKVRNNRSGDKPLVFTTKQSRTGSEEKEVKTLIKRSHITGNFAWVTLQRSVAYTVLPFYCNEYWYGFPLYKHTGSFKQYDTQNEEIYCENVQTKMVERGTKIQRSKNLWGWSALGATVIGAVAATAYVANYAIKMFKTDTK